MSRLMPNVHRILQQRVKLEIEGGEFFHHATLGGAGDEEGCRGSGGVGQGSAGGADTALPVLLI